MTVIYDVHDADISKNSMENKRGKCGLEKLLVSERDDDEIIANIPLPAKKAENELKKLPINAKGNLKSNL